jgi:hypothetical protein
VCSRHINVSQQQPECAPAQGHPGTEHTLAGGPRLRGPAALLDLRQRTGETSPFRKQCKDLAHTHGFVFINEQATTAGSDVVAERRRWTSTDPRAGLLHWRVVWPVPPASVLLFDRRLLYEVRLHIDSGARLACRNRSRDCRRDHTPVYRCLYSALLRWRNGACVYQNPVR